MSSPSATGGGFLPKRPSWRQAAAVIGVVAAIATIFQVVMPFLGRPSNSRASGTPAVSLADRVVFPSQIVQARGVGFGTRETLDLGLTVPLAGEDTTLRVAGRFETDSDGNFSLDFQIPIKAIGANRLTVSGQRTGKSASAELTVAALEPSIALNPSVGPAQTKIEISGDGFLPQDTVDLTVKGRTIASITTDSQGAFSYQLTLQSKDPARTRQIVVEAHGRKTSMVASTADPAATFTFQKEAGPAPAASPTPPQLPPATPVVLGDGWGVDLDNGAVGQAFMAAGIDISVGPGLEGDELDAGDGAAIYVVQAPAAQPGACSAGRATQSVQLPVRSDLCILTGQGNLATLNVTGSSATGLTFRYRLWTQ